MLGARLKKDIYDAMQSLEYEINTLFTSNGQTPLLLRLVLVLGPIASNGKSKRRFWKFGLRVLIGTSDSYLSKTDLYPQAGLNLEPGTPNYDIKQLALNVDEAHVSGRFVL